MKKRRFVIFLLLFVSFIIIVNSETDFFYNIEKYIPQIERSAPTVAKSVSDLSQRLSDFTDSIPTPAEIVAMIRHEELPIDPSDIAVNAYITDSPLLSFFPDENAGIICEDGKKVQIFGIVSSKEKQHIVFMFSDAAGNEIEKFTTSANNDGEFSKTITIPSTDSDEIKIDIFTNSKAYGDFESWAYNYLYLARTENGWELKKSPVYENNKALYEKEKSVSDALKNTSMIQANNKSVAEVADLITAYYDSDYDKLLAIHDWVCENLYYDLDNINSTLTLPYAASDVLTSKRAVCLGFANLSAALCRSIGIPCNVVSGYALGITSDTSWSEKNIGTDEPNHAWNEAYVDGRWVIFDTTWDCANKIKDGVYTTEGQTSHIYFDANLDFFSANHRLMEYMKVR